MLGGPLSAMMAASAAAAASRLANRRGAGTAGGIATVPAVTSAVISGLVSTDVFNQSPHSLSAYLSPADLAALDRDDEGLCVVCLESVASVLLAPCGHMVVCKRCCGEVRAATNEVRHPNGSLDYLES